MKNDGVNNSDRAFPPLTLAERIELWFSYTLKSIVVITIIISVIHTNFFHIASGIIILLFSVMPALIARKMRITLPVEVDLVITIFIFMHFMLGEAGDYYTRYPYFDLVLHLLSGIIIGLVGFVIIYFFFYTNRIRMNPALVVLFSVSFSLAAGALWEIIEFLLDNSFGFNMQKPESAFFFDFLATQSGLEDTMMDLMVDFLGACIVGLGAFRYLTKGEDGIIKVLVNRFIQYNVRLRIKRQKRKSRRQNDPAPREQITGAK